MRICSSNSIKHALALVAVSTLSACGQSEQGATAEQSPPVVSVADVVVQPLADWDEFSGRLQAPESVELRPRVSGHIDRVLFRDGSLVKKGDLLFQIDPRPFQAEVDRLDAQLQQARARQTRAASEAQRGEKLRANQAISAELADARKTAYQEASSAVAATRAQLEAARLNLSFTRITAPIDGRISRAQVTAGNLVNEGATLLTTIVGTKELHAYFDIDEATYLKQVRRIPSEKALAHSRVPVHLALSTDERPAYEGRLDFLDNQVNPRTGTLQARAVVDNGANELTPGLYVRLQLPASDLYPATLVRDEAIGTDLGNRFVLVLGKDAVVSYRAVRLGPKVEGLRVIREGLQEGERILVNGLQRARPGARVTPEQVAMATDEVLARLTRLNTSIEPTPVALQDYEPTPVAQQGRERRTSP
ncbi:Multidrug efflux system, membrane fusion component MexE [Pseudomonas chlororaphis subsp. piscium]|uniref:efflux RND transporter periplasmic adaptor subunit n=1 Tax=Pseudomonas chlororaphis TaxID=587753 RepID=UPI0006A5ED9C|nr:efflux RND transporter periplasmic adaptor subunit [Pseudomonas chlororaphis]AZC31781.1 Multidrug efflux system, membrane fusion component MexE [Pseudomonas chlororaphis subsp. piscium]WDG89550.1 efflux RND transporter periplasmic adaptor subunit [Pseudomonas chlororaphis]SDS82629.1 membrane fusion protein, multidrug efflux system [Pseudomonas chlororaphis]